ncbi:MAG: hypothetical protein ACXU8A_06400 [Burkholderiaceae bacterium]
MNSPQKSSSLTKDELQSILTEISQDPSLWHRTIVASTKREDKGIDPFRWIADFLRALFCFLFGRHDFSRNQDANNAAREFVQKNGNALGVMKSAIEGTLMKKTDTDKDNDFIWSGKLLDHGTERFLGDQNNDESYFATILQIDGVKHTLWGDSLKDAVADFNIGDEITFLCQHDSQEVNVPIVDDRGNVLRHEVRTIINKTWYSKACIANACDADEEEVTFAP